MFYWSNCLLRIDAEPREETLAGGGLDFEGLRGHAAISSFVHSPTRLAPLDGASSVDALNGVCSLNGGAVAAYGRRRVVYSEGVRDNTSTTYNDMLMYRTRSRK